MFYIYHDICEGGKNAIFSIFQKSHFVSDFAGVRTRQKNSKITAGCTVGRVSASQCYPPIATVMFLEYFMEN